MSAPTTAPTFLRTEYQIDPLGLDETEPRFSWLLADGRRGARQTGYHVLVASSLDRLNRNDADFWDSGEVASDDTAQIAYAGVPLRAFCRAFWKVRVKDSEGQRTPWSQSARFELGPLALDDWTLGAGPWSSASFIRSSVVGNRRTSPPAPLLRRKFVVDGEVLNARLYITALGLYEVSVNGHLVSDAVFRPGWTDYDLRVPSTKRTT